MTAKTYIEELWVGIKADISHLQMGLLKSKAEARSFVGAIGAASGQLRSFGKVVTGTSAIISASFKKMATQSSGCSAIEQHSAMKPLAASF